MLCDGLGRILHILILPHEQRSKHLKCDRQKPCARCVNMQSECVYVASRRGQNGSRRRAVHTLNKRQATSRLDLSSGTSDYTRILGARTGSTDIPTVAVSAFGPPSVGIPPQDNDAAQFTQSQQRSNMHLYKSYRAVNGIDPSGWIVNQTRSQIPLPVPVVSLEERCFDSFYHYFHASHPFVLPKPFLLHISKEISLQPLLAAIRWVGSMFIGAGTMLIERFLNEAYGLIYDPERPKDGFLIQSMMLLIVGLDGRCQQDEARGILGDVETLALELGLNTREFATTHGRGIPVLEESWRRTWWDLFVIDGMIAGLQRATEFLLFDVPPGAALPCEEYYYLTAVSAEMGIWKTSSAFRLTWFCRKFPSRYIWTISRTKAFPAKTARFHPSRTAYYALEI